MTNPFLSLAVLDTDLDFSVTKHPNPYCAQMGLKGVCDTSAPSRPPPLRGRGTPSYSAQTAGPANHNHEPAARLSAGHSPAPQPPRPVLPASFDAPMGCLSVYGGPLILRFAWCGRARRFCAPATLRPAGGCTAASSQTAGHSRRPERR